MAMAVSARVCVAMRPANTRPHLHSRKARAGCPRHASTSSTPAERHGRLVAASLLLVDGDASAQEIERRKLPPAGQGLQHKLPPCRSKTARTATAQDLAQKTKLDPMQFYRAI
mmetsp:Transcript_89900/g.226079  ORF Transcript_89900/g.226079 Transcript_89900/m.226079 type:complete len:113 (-) Transcript_89900:41-379(-)